MPNRGPVVGYVISVRSVPNSDRIRVATVRLGDDEPVEIVFGGEDVVHEGSLVPVAPPGSWIQRRLGREGPTKIRRRRYRGQVSHGMLCSLRPPAVSEPHGV